MKIGILKPDEAGKRAKAAVAKWEADEKRKRAEREAAERRAASRSVPVEEKESRRRAAEFARAKPEPEGLAGGGRAAMEPNPNFRVRGLHMSKEEMKQLDDALVKAVKEGDLVEVSVLLDRNADPDAKDADGKAVLIIATWNGFVEIAEVLKGKGADTEVKDADGLTAIFREKGT